ncbi:phthiocerol/phenolphthiocerol synthesis type-I polyketide synthase E [Streptomyces luteogriseus]|uniref:type I polyketide synthase n=1 Tax=Streptomyces luteogriseus TaxID=68233 RepID=UPI002786D783|nr:beta-ketoacyl synthase N-terminal-like domain-containing protein [Streptomyces luteogriseus]MDQ0714036.1 phthiocerol/phenolphthiocerol synthesis type-I polyketide synthase E [Streptomyces luteogriseus]
MTAAHRTMTRDRSLDIAVTGMSGRFPGAPDIASLWVSVLGGEVLTTRFGAEELAAAGVPHHLLAAPGYVPVHGALADPYRFEHELFGISPREAELMDPQHRLMLEAAWAALEDAGCAPNAAGPTTGVYASASSSGYLRAMLTSGTLDHAGVEQALRANEPDYMATRIAYRLGLTGPALSVLTACSSSLVAVHLAVQSLLQGECDQAVVVASAVGHPQVGYLHVPGGILSSHGVCRPFDAEADGTLGGSGVAAVVLRRYEDALKDGAPLHGVILGSAVNNDGAAKAGYHAPSAEGQEAVIRAAMSAADVPGDSVGYLEAHATGTRIGDPIEWSAATAAYRGIGAGSGQIAVGAVKANIGHLDAASGLVSLVKALLVLREGKVPPVAGFHSRNPLLDDGSPLTVPTAARDWDGPEPRRAGVSSFGIGGTNAHVVLEQPPARPAPQGPTPPADRLLVLSAANPRALRDSARRLAAALTRGGDCASVVDTAHTLAAGRATLPHRLAVTGREPAEVARRLTEAADRVPDKAAPSGRRASGPVPVVFLLPGQGSQYPGMARPFAQVLPGFADVLEECLQAFGPDLERRLRPALHDPDHPAAGTTRTELAQPMLFAVEYAAAQALRELGVEPVALAGHSLGEITAACLAGALDLPSAATFVAARGRAMQSCPPGAMLHVAVSERQAEALLAQAAPHIGGELEIAAVNTPDSCVVAGPTAWVEAFRTWLADRVPTRRLHTSHAFHTSLLAPAVDEVGRAAGNLRTGPTRIPYVSNVTGQLIMTGSRVDPASLVAQMRARVLFGPGLDELAERFPQAIALEVGPGRALSPAAEAAGLTAVPLSPGRGRHPAEEMLGALGDLWSAGAAVDVTPLCASGRVTRLPSYPFHGPALIAPEASATAGTTTAAPAQPSVPPAPHLLVAALWQEYLGHPDLPVDADFFDWGGDSLLITRLARRISQDLGVQVFPRDLMAARTLAGQTQLVADLVRAAGPAGHEEPR